MANDTAPAEQHFMDRIGWLRAAVLGANDGIVSTASLIAGAAVPLGAVAMVATALVGAVFGTTVA